MLLRNRIKLEHDDLCNGSRGVVVGFKKSATGISTHELIPVVKFDNGVKVPIGRVDFEMDLLSNDKEEKIKLTRKQLPLKLAWALTVHKAQGSTLTRAELHVRDAFEHGQVYVALSRLTSLKGLWLDRSIPIDRIRTHSVVENYYKEIEKYNAISLLDTQHHSSSQFEATYMDEEVDIFEDILTVESEQRQLYDEDKGYGDEDASTLKDDFRDDFPPEALYYDDAGELKYQDALPCE